MQRKSKIVVNQNVLNQRCLYSFFKRRFDVVLSIIALIILSPLFCVIAVAIKLDRSSPGPVFYSQIRIGKNGCRFRIYKFRSMVVDADEKFSELLHKNEIAGAMFKMKDDPRVTKVGRIIRKHSLDELPQLWNVLKGDMTLVGPRPPLEREIKEYTNFDMQRLVVKPGCTGLWQVTERNSVSFYEMVKIDITYINKANFWMDTRILLKTIFVMCVPNTAY
ncbi:sugar transferase [Lactobacillus sp. ESL0791]|uniref:sugar transferase n=1 Tax=Lactobacillus sp. ESL0791 TaxID=2983234 RepID=UPI0023F9EC78|nr:sugar transferase [Lactobacillus sp. ESL0791]MDF7639827.1 sugar transferase [Lactobacillus sp. ESL0791]